MAAPDYLGQPVTALSDPPLRSAFPENFPDVIILHPDSSPVHPRAHSNYKAAKAGNVDAAFRLVSDVLDAAKIELIRDMIGGRAVAIIAVHAEEAAGRNKIPQAYAEILGDALALTVDDGVVQANRPHRTGSSALHRISTRSVFDGLVQRGKAYLIVDDHVSQGGTLADLRAYIEGQGGHVIGATTLTGNGKAAKLAPSKSSIELLRQKFPGLESDWKRGFGYGFEGLTQSEADYLARFNAADSIRNSVFARGQEGSER